LETAVGSQSGLKPIDLIELIARALSL
jgi:hypothetical protein